MSKTVTGVVLLFDVGNTNTHLGLAKAGRIVRQADVPTSGWIDNTNPARVARFLQGRSVRGAAVCSVVPNVTPKIVSLAKKAWQVPCFELRHSNLLGVGIDYPKPESIGPDRLANAVAARKRFGAPVVVVDFGTAVTFDVVNAAGDYIGGIIAPGLSAMTDYLHEKTALLPRITIRDVDSAIGKSTRHAMLVGAVHGYRGLIRGLITELKQEMSVRRLPVVATGGYARLISAKLPEITAVDPALTLEGLLLAWQSALEK